MSKNTVEFAAMAPEVAQRNISRIAKIGQKTRALIHATAMGILLHAKEHGDYTKMISLVEAVASGQSKGMAKLLVQWVVDNTPLNYVAEFKSKVDGKTITNPHSFVNSKDKSRKYDEVKGGETPYYEMEKEEDLRPVDFGKLLNSVLQRAFTAREAGNLKEGDKLDAVAAAIGFTPKRDLTEAEKEAAKEDASIEALERKLAERKAARDAKVTEGAVG